MGLWSAFVSRIPLRLLASGTPSAGQVPTALSATRAEWQTPSASGGPATQIQESSGPTTLTVGAIADGEFAKRVGATIVGAAAGGGGAPVGASYVVLGLDATLTAERKLTAGTGVTLNDGGVGGNATVAADIGTGAGQVASATDARLSDARTPTAHAASHNAGGGDALAIDAAAGTGSLRTLGTGATAACGGADARLSDDRTASGIRTATTVVVASASAAPAAKDVLRALGSTSAAWVPENGPGGVGGHTGGGGLARLYVPGARGATALTTGAPTANVLRAVPFVCPNRKGTIDQLSLRTTVGGAGSSARLGLYRTASSANLYPGALIDETAALGTTGIAHTVGAVSATFDPGEILWVAHVASATVPTITCIALAAADVQLFGFDSALGNAAAVGISVAHTFGALPATFTAGGAVITAAPIPAIGVRFAT